MISIVICTFNRAATLQQMLSSFFQQNQLDTIQHELLVVDNNSNDDTAMIVKEFLSSGDVRYLLETNQGLSFARNRGISESKGEIVSFLDDDVLVNENWLISLKRCFEETGADVVGGKVSLKFAVPPGEWVGDLFRKCLSEVDIGNSRKALSDGDRLYGANLSFKRKVFESIGFFDTHTGRTKRELVSGEETHLVRRIIAKEGTVIYDPDVLVEHLIAAERLQWEYFMRRASGDGVTREFLDPKAPWGFQILRVCMAIVMFVKAMGTKYSFILRDRDSYEARLAAFEYRRAKSYLAARFARLLKEFGKSRSNQHTVIGKEHGSR